MERRYKRACLLLAAVLLLGGAANYQAGRAEEAVPVQGTLSMEYPGSFGAGEAAVVALLQGQLAQEEQAAAGLTEAQRALLEEFCAAQGEYFSLAVYDIASGDSYAYNEDQYYYAASTLKAPYALWLAQRADAGEIDLEEELPNLFRGSLSGWLADYRDAETVPARAALAAMIGNSDNEGMRLLAARWPASEESGFSDYVVQELGMASTLGASITYEGGVQAYTTAADNLLFLQALYRYCAGGAENAEWLRGVFCAADHDVLYVPQGVQAAKKYGSWDGAFHDEMIVYARRPYLIACYTGWGDQAVNFPAEATAVMQELGRLVYDMLGG